LEKWGIQGRKARLRHSRKISFRAGGAVHNSWKAVFDAVKTVPRGRVITYGQLAKYLRLPGGARTAGRAMAHCASGHGVPWHRVLGAGGRLLIREPLRSLQRKLLESEGVSFTRERVDLTRHGWNQRRRVRMNRKTRASRR
jgi:methylated-DNA-protein-cysteine methyltransferase related protein